ncbi:MAG: ATP-binding protein [Kofleriaceae bacterium]
MKRPGVPPDEEARLRTLASYDILDTEAEVQFDALSRLAAITLDAPIALVSLVDRDRQWFKSRYGLDARHTGRDISFCGHAVEARGTLVVADASADPRFADNPLVVGDPHIRFYAGVPLETPEGHVLGTLCTIDRRPRELTTAQRETLELLATQVMALLELRRVARELREQREQLVTQTTQLAARERELATLLDIMVEGVVLQDPSGSIILHNQAAEAILGLRSDDLTGRTSFDPRWQATRADGTEFGGKEHPAIVALERGVPSRDVTMGLVHAESGDQKWIEINSYPLFDSRPDRPYAALTTFRDVTEQRRMQQRLAQHDRLVTTGTLAAGVGHEINNPLTYLMANVSLAIEELGEIGGGSPPARLVEIVHMLEQAREGGERVKRIVRGLKSLARNDGQVAPLDPQGSIRNAIELAGHELRSRAQVVLELEPVPPILADEGRLTQLIVNLVVNAAQSFTTDTPASNRITLRSRHDRDRVILEVVDNGPGILPDVLPRIFDPFFTTKPPGVGTGLGLSISHGIVAAMGGQFDCETELGRGTVFRVSVPVAHVRPVEATIASSAAGRAMVVDDEQTILESLSRTLRKELGTVETFDDPRVALAAIARGERYDVVFSDILMPHMTGIDLYRSVREIDADQSDRFVFISGDITRSDIQEFLARVSNERIEKPFSIQNVRGIARRFVASRKSA